MNGLALSFDSFAPTSPEWMLREQDAEMQISDLIRKCVVFIGTQTRIGFAASGTGFIYISCIDNQAFQQIVTARHVIDGFGDSEFCIRINKKDGGTEELPTQRDNWIPHPDKTVDLALSPCDLIKPAGRNRPYDILNLDDRHVLTPELIRQLTIGIGDDVFLTGSYVQRVGEAKNLPIVRVGNIAAMAEEPIWPASPKRPAYLVEVRSLGGISGSPVFVHLGGIRTYRGSLRIGTDINQYLLGVSIGLHDIKHGPDMAPSAEADAAPPTDALFNSGLTVVLPVDLMIEMIDQPNIRNRRLEWIEKMKKESGFRPTSARDCCTSHTHAQGV